MLYAKVVLGLPVEGPFDYIVPKELKGKTLPGARVWVNFRNKKSVGYVTALSRKSGIKNLKELIAVIDSFPVLGENILKLARRISDYYCCSLGEAIETALPDDLRKGRRFQNGDTPIRTSCLPSAKVEAVLKEKVVLRAGEERWPFYLNKLRQALKNRSSGILLFSDIPSAEKAKSLIEKELGISAYLVYRKQPAELEVWQKIRQEEFCVVVGTRSAVFAPVNNPGLIIVDHEEDTVYKQEQVPHYHARQASLMRSEIENTALVLSSAAGSLESQYLVRQNRFQVRLLERKKPYPEIKIIDTRRLSYADRKKKPVISKFLADSIYNTLAEKGKILLFLNRRGFATYAACNNCRVALRCPRCNISLVYHFEEGLLKCHHCTFKMTPPKICPQCKSGYIKYSGLGTEKIESELARIFPQARIRNLENNREFKLEEADIFVSTSSVLKHGEFNFQLIAVAGVDNALNRVDPAAAEKVYSALSWLTLLTDRRMIIQTANPAHHCFRALAKNEPDIFYKEEMEFRRQLGFPPLRHFVLLKVRGKVLEKVKKAGEELFERLKKDKPAGLKIISFSPGHPPKLRGNFYYQILISALKAEKVSKFLKSGLKSARYSGIIVTVDVDPV